MNEQDQLIYEINQPAPKTTNSVAYFVITEQPPCNFPIYIKFFYGITIEKYNVVGSLPMADYRKAYKINNTGKYLCQLRDFQPNIPMKPVLYTISVFSKEGVLQNNELISFTKWSPDMPKNIQPVECTLLSEADAVHFDDAETKCNRTAFIPASIVAIGKNDTKFVVFDIPGYARAYEWFTSNQPTQELFRFVRSMSDFLENKSFKLIDNDTGKEIIPEGTIRESLTPKEKGTARTRFSLRAVPIIDEKSPNNDNNDKFLMT